MLPALTFTPKRFAIPRRRLLLAAGGATLLTGSILSAFVVPTPRSADELTASRSLAERLSISTWALAVPTAWLAAPVAEVRSGDSVDLLAVRIGDHAEPAFELRKVLVVLSEDERGMAIVVEGQGYLGGGVLARRWLEFLPH